MLRCRPAYQRHQHNRHAKLVMPTPLPVAHALKLSGTLDQYWTLEAGDSSWTAFVSTKRSEANLLDNSRNLGRPSQPRPNNPAAPPSRGNTSSPSAYSPSSLVPPNNLPAPASPSSSASTMQVNEQAHQSNQGHRNPPMFFRDPYANFIVKGNFMTLAARPALVEEGEWLAHQRKSDRTIIATVFLLSCRGLTYKQWSSKTAS